MRRDKPRRRARRGGMDLERAVGPLWGEGGGDTGTQQRTRRTALPAGPLPTACAQRLRRDSAPASHVSGRPIGVTRPKPAVSPRLRARQRSPCAGASTLFVMHLQLSPLPSGTSTLVEKKPHSGHDAGGPFRIAAVYLPSRWRRIDPLSAAEPPHPLPNRIRGRRQSAASRSPVACIAHLSLYAKTWSHTCSGIHTPLPSVPLSPFFSSETHQPFRGLARSHLHPRSQFPPRTHALLLLLNMTAND